MVAIEKIQLPVPGIELLVEEAQAEGYDFLQTLVDDWATAKNRFNGPGEALYGGLEHDQLVAVGGLNCDPFAGQADMGRIRRVYVRRGWRNAGVGRNLVNALVDEARKSFRSVRLRAENADAARLYERIGFVPVPGPDATHILTFSGPIKSLVDQDPDGGDSWRTVLVRTS